MTVQLVRTDVIKLGRSAFLNLMMLLSVARGVAGRGIGRAAAQNEDERI